jgi:integrase
VAWAEELPSGRYRGGYRGPDGRKRQRGGFLHKPAALRWAEDAEDAAWRGEDPDAGRMPLSEWADKWEAARVVELSTEASDRGRLAAIRDEFGDTPLDRITVLAVQSWVKTLSRGGRRRRTAGTVRKYFNLLSAMLGAAVDEGLIPANPCRRVKLPAAGGGREVFLTEAEVDKLDLQLAGIDGTVAFVLAYTGLRWGELAGLHVDQIDRNLRGVLVRRTLVELNHAMSIKDYPKGVDRRFIPLPQHVLTRLDEHLETNPAQPCKLRRVDGSAHRCPGLVFTEPPTRERHRRTGLPLSRRWNRRIFKPAATIVGLPDDVTVHDLRHTYASWLVQAGVPLREVQAVMGHKSIRTTERYAHLQRHVGDRARAALERGVDRG